MKRLVIDTETTGLRKDFHQILTVGMLAVDFKPKKMKILDERHIFIKHPEYNISRTAMRINGNNLTEHHKIGVFPKFACNRIGNFIDTNDLWESPTVGHNVHFDRNFLNFMFDLEKEKSPIHPKKEDTRYIWDRLKRSGVVNPLLNSKLGTIAGHFGIDYSKAHDALVDCEITAKVYHKMLPLTKI